MWRKNSEHYLCCRRTAGVIFSAKFSKRKNAICTSGGVAEEDNEEKTRGLIFRIS